MSALLTDEIYDDDIDCENDLYEDEEEIEGCGCDLDYDDEEETEDEDEYESKKKSKTPEKKVEDYLAVLRSNFDSVVWETRKDEWFEDIEYQHLELRMYASPQNLNPNIDYEVWLELDLKNEGHFTRHKDHLKYICDNLKRMRSEDATFYEKDKEVVVDNGWTYLGTGMPHNGEHKKHTGMSKPTTQEIADEVKRVIGYVFDGVPIFMENFRFGRYDDYWFDTSAWHRHEFLSTKKDEGVEPLVLFETFLRPMRIFLGKPIKRWSNIREEEMVDYWIWADPIRSWNDRNGFSHEIDLLNDSDLLDWLYAFTGAKRKEHDVEGEKMKMLIGHLQGFDGFGRSPFKDVEDWPKHLEALARKAKSAKELRSVLTDGVKYDNNGGFAGSGLRFLSSSGNYCLDKKMEYKIYMPSASAKYLNRSATVFDAKTEDIFEVVYDYFNPKAKVLSLFDDFDIEEAEPANNVQEEEAEFDPFSLFA